MSQWPLIEQLAHQVNSQQATAKNMVKQAYKMIDYHNDYSAILSKTEERAFQRAALIDKTIQSGHKSGRLAGVPFIAKDNFLCFGAETTAASNILKGFEAPYQATAIEKLEAEGAICVAKANLDAFAHGSSTENSDFMVTKNPHDKNRVPGGSSGGSAAAVVLEMVPFALGTDTGGSIRLPASFCGAVGVKPSYGLISRSGVIAMASSTDVIGPLTTNVADAALVIDVMRGRDAFDSTTIDLKEDKDHRNFLLADYDLQGKKVGIIKEYMTEGLDREVRARIENATRLLTDAGASVIEISMPSLDYALAVYYILVPAEVSSNLSRYDGQRYGYKSKESTNLEESYRQSRSTGFGKEAKRRIMIGTYVLSSGYYDAYYKRAQIVRTKLINEFNDSFQKVDFMVAPTAATTAFPIGQNINDPLQMYLTDILTVAVNLVGIPAVSIPAGLSSLGLPIGLQIFAKQQNDIEMLSFAHKTESILK